MRPDAAAGRFLLTSSRAVFVLGGAVVVLTVGSIPLAIASHVASGSGVPSLLLPLAFGAVGAVVARHQPRNPVGWLLLGVALFFTINGIACIDRSPSSNLPGNCDNVLADEAG